MENTALIIFTKNLSPKDKKVLQQQSLYEVVVSPEEVREEVALLARTWVSIEEYIAPGSIYEASILADELSRAVLPDGTRVTKSFMYKGFELWWIHYNTLFLSLCMPFIRYKALLEYVKEYREVHVHGVSCNQLVFSAYLTAHGCTVRFLNESQSLVRTLFPVGILVQIFLTLLSLPVLMVTRQKVLVFTGDKFAKGGDYDFRMEYIYRELRKQKISFVESIRSLESWKTVLAHAYIRKRPVLYATAIMYVARYISIFTWSHHKQVRLFSPEKFSSVPDPEKRFKLIFATQCLTTAYYDVWEIRMQRVLLRFIGVKAMFAPAANERNLHTVLGAKLNKIPTIGILHGSASQYYNAYDFTPSYDGEKSMSVDTYGLWSEWWKEYYSMYSKAYRKEQLCVSGLMRPYDIPQVTNVIAVRGQVPLRVLFVSEQLAVPSEIIPYLEALSRRKDVETYLVFRPYRDEFEAWLTKNRPDILSMFGEERILRNGIKEALASGDVVVGSHSTAVLEALFQKKPMVFFETKKWGDYFSLAGYSTEYSFYAHSPSELIDAIQKITSIPVHVLEKLEERFFGDPSRNGSKWVVDRIASMLRDTN